MKTIEKELLKAIKIEGKEIDFILNNNKENTKHLKSLENFVKKLFNEYRNEVV
tara:strand:+ start:487 stop:645 length:159 start_codon:yes stop_codon:yes gene_type:complete